MLKQRDDLVASRVCDGAGLNRVEPSHLVPFGAMGMRDIGRTQFEEALRKSLAKAYVCYFTKSTSCRYLYLGSSFSSGFTRYAAV
jgi:hypothetical protein